jgi:hypothetical protein
LVVRWGVRGARGIYLVLTAGVLAVGAAAIASGTLPFWYAVPALGLAALGCWAASGISTRPADRPGLARSIQITLAIHTFGGFALVAAILGGHLR